MAQEGLTLAGYRQVRQLHAELCKRLPDGGRRNHQGHAQHRPKHRLGRSNSNGPGTPYPMFSGEHSVSSIPALGHYERILAGNARANVAEASIDDCEGLKGSHAQLSCP